MTRRPAAGGAAWQAGDDGLFAALPITILLTSGVAFFLASSASSPLLFGLIALLVGQAFALAATGMGERRSAPAGIPSGPAAEFAGVSDGAVMEALQHAQDQVDATASDRYVVAGPMGRLSVRLEPPSSGGTAYILIRSEGGVVLGEVARGPFGDTLRRHDEGALLAGVDAG